MIKAPFINLICAYLPLINQYPFQLLHPKICIYNFHGMRNMHRETPGAVSVGGIVALFKVGRRCWHSIWMNIPFFA
jgi:hypothetical protein